MTLNQSPPPAILTATMLTPAMLTPDLLAPTFIGFALSAALFHGRRLLVAQMKKRECERHMGFWRLETYGATATAIVEHSPIDICIVSP